MIHLFPCLSDNYGFLLHDESTGLTAAIDTPDGAKIEQECKRHGLRLTHILNTHHHYDHVDGNLSLKEKYGVTIIGPKADENRIPGIDIAYEDGDVFNLGRFEIQLLHTPGHTTGHCAYYIQALESAFVGDTLFALGCGRLFEGSAQDMFDSLAKICALPDQTKIYCAHEYTSSNGEFALSVEPDNKDLQAYMSEVIAKRTKNLPTIPTTISQEKKANPFVRAKDVQTLARIRAAKDKF